MAKGLSLFFAMGALLVWGGKAWADETISSTPVATPVQTVTADKPAPFSFADFTWLNGLMEGAEGQSVGQQVFHAGNHNGRSLHL